MPPHVIGISLRCMNLPSRSMSPFANRLPGAILLRQRLGVCALCLVLAAFSGLTGCNRSNPYLTSSPSGFTLANPTAGAADPQGAYGAQLAELERRAKLLDDNNRQLTTQLAQSQQQMQLYKERSELMQRQLAEVNNQLQGSRLPTRNRLNSFADWPIAFKTWSPLSSDEVARNSQQTRVVV